MKYELNYNIIINSYLNYINTLDANNYAYTSDVVNKSRTSGSSFVIPTQGITINYCYISVLSLLKEIIYLTTMLMHDNMPYMQI